MQGIFQKENTDKALKYGIYRHLPTYEKIIRNLVSFWMKNLYLPYSDSSAKVGYSWTIYQIILPKVKRDVLLGMVTTKFLDDLIDECDGYSK